MRIFVAITLGVLLMFSCVNQADRARQQAVVDSIANVDAELAAEKTRIKADEKRIADSTAKANHEFDVKNSIKIVKYYLSSPNSAGGVDAHFRFTNLNDKVIKYLSWRGYPINAVGDPVSCSIRNCSTQGGKATGPFKKGQTSGSEYWECMWYNYQAKKLILTEVDIEYMDGSTFNITGDDLYLIGKIKE